MFDKEILSGLTTLLTLIAFFPYVRAILKKETQPHLFSWIIWGLTTCLVFVAQLTGGGGIGAWPTGISGLISLYIAVMAYRYKADTHITRMDWICLMGALLSIPLWAVTSDPFWAVLLLTTIDTIGFVPTIRKAYHQPFSENMTMYLIMLFRNLVGILALETYSATTILFPAVMSLTIVLAVPVIWFRRQRPSLSSAERRR
jgi:hypothetical protein